MESPELRLSTLLGHTPGEADRSLRRVTGRSATAHQWGAFGQEQLYGHAAISSPLSGTQKVCQTRVHYPVLGFQSLPFSSMM